MQNQLEVNKLKDVADETKGNDSSEATFADPRGDVRFFGRAKRSPFVSCLSRVELYRSIVH